MGEHDVKPDTAARHQQFMRSLLEEVRALDRMLECGRIESGVRRIGAEQEMFIVDRAFGPANQAEAILERIGDRRFTYELGRFNLEANLSPRVFGGECLALMERELQELYERARDTASLSSGDSSSMPRMAMMSRNSL